MVVLQVCLLMGRQGLPCSMVVMIFNLGAE